MKTGDNESQTEAPTAEDSSLITNPHGAVSNKKTREPKVDTTKEAGHSPKKVDKPQKPQPKNSSSEEPSVFGNNFGEFLQFLHDCWLEFRKISWPTRQQVIKETWSVLVLVTLITGSVLAFDWLVGRAVFEPLDKFAKKLGGGVGHTAERWGPLAPVPGAPVNNPNLPGNALPQGKMPPRPVPSEQPANAPGGNAPAPSSATPGGQAPAQPAAAPGSGGASGTTPSSPSKP